MTKLLPALSVLRCFSFWAKGKHSAMSLTSYVLGIDIGTSGVRCLVIDEAGQTAAQAAGPLPPPVVTGSRHEQDAELWWQSTADAVREVCRDLREDGGRTENIAALCVDATSGTIVPVDSRLQPLRTGLMYNDARAHEEAEQLNAIGTETLSRLGYRFNASFSLAKMFWLLRHEPDMMDRAAWVVHQSDFITARLSQVHGMENRPVSDESNALKSGYDILEHCWPAYLSKIGMDEAKLPQVKKIGQTLGSVSKAVAADLGLPPGCVIVGGMTDGTAGCVASGANRIGDMNTTLGTTIVWKMIASTMICDPEGRLYSHRHPGGGFLPGGAGNAGGEGLASFFQGGSGSLSERLSGLASGITPGIPTGTLTYPLSSPGERFPFVDPAFEPFTTVSGRDERLLYQSCLEGIACIERWGYEVARGLGAETGGGVWTTGKGAGIAPWLQIRADMLDRPVCRAANPESAYGTALVAAMNAWFKGSWEDTAAHLIRESYRCEPRKQYRAACDEQYQRFREACQDRSRLA